VANIARSGEANACLVFSTGRLGAANASRGDRMRNEAAATPPIGAKTMDRMLSSKWVLYVMIAFAVAYLWVQFGTPHFDPSRYLK
jgi:hypothetical protein